MCDNKVRTVRQGDAISTRKRTSTDAAIEEPGPDDRRDDVVPTIRLELVCRLRACAVERERLDRCSVIVSPAK
jgi:hypothetical protein